MNVRLVVLCGIALVGCSTDQTARNTEKSEYHYKLAAGYFFDQNIPMANKELDTALTLNPRHERAHFLVAFIAMGRKSYSDALLHYKLALEVKPDYYEARENLGATYLAMKRWDDAIEALTPLTSANLYPTPFILQNNLGLACRAKGQVDKALQYFKTAIFLNPRFCLGYFNYGETLAQTGNTIEAARQFKKAVAKCPSYADPYFHLATILERNGKVTEAAENYRLCVKYGGDSSLADRCRVRLGESI